MSSVLILACSPRDYVGDPSDSLSDTIGGATATATTLAGQSGLPVGGHSSVANGGTTASYPGNTAGGASSYPAPINVSGATYAAGGTVATSTTRTGFSGGAISAGGASSIGGTKSTAGTTSAAGTKASGGTTSTGGTKANTGGTKPTGGTTSIGGTTGTGGTKSSGGTTSASSSSFCSTYTDLGTLPPTTSQGISLPTTAICYRFTVASTSQLFHGLQMSNCDARTALINGKDSGCTPATGCSAESTIERAADGYFYVSFSAGTTTYCTAGWWWW